LTQTSSSSGEKYGTTLSIEVTFVKKEARQEEGHPSKIMCAVF
jgi:hypothetical protein